MTSLGLQYGELKLKQKQLDETKRYNLAQESLKRQEIAETVANNLRNYRINISKNQIQRLANDQLNDREIQKIGETIRSDLAKELETNRHNLATEEQARADLVAKELGKSGKYSLGSIAAAIFGLMPPEEMKQLYGSKSINVQSSSVLDAPSVSTSLPDWSKPTDVMNWARKAANYENYQDEKRVDELPDRQKKAAEQVRDIHWDDPERPMYTSHNASRRGRSVYGHSETDKELEKNEIPYDYSSSRGPGYDNSPVNNYPSSRGPGYDISPINYLTVPAGSSNSQSGPRGTNTSGGTDYHLSGGHVSSGVIYAGRS